MPDPVVAGGSILAGALATLGALAVLRGGVVRHLDAALAQQARDGLRGGRPAALRRRFELEIARAGWNDTPQRVATLAVALSAALSALGLSTIVVADAGTAASLAAGGAIAGTASVWFVLRNAAGRRRTRLTRELAPLLELFVLELGGGGSALSALGSVTMQVDGELAAELRRLLIASQLSGSASFEFRLRAYAETMQIPALGSLATILTASREYGTAVTQGVRALAADLRRHQRRELIAHSRRALNHVLFPAAIGVLLPFLAILLFPAVTSLQRNLR